MALIRPKSYQVLITPLVGRNTYGTEQDITKDVEIDDYIKENGISTIKREVDNGDFDFGSFVFGSINITAINFDGKFCDSDDSRSMFLYSRDKAKVTINFFDGLSNSPVSSFKGIIDDRATKANFKRSEVKLTLLSNDSIINRVKIPSGAVTNGSLISEAIKTILQLTDITSVLTYDEAYINVLNDYVIDDGSRLDNKTVKNGLNALLRAANSVFVVDKDTNKMMVRSRDFNSGNIVNLYGHGDTFGRENIIDIINYNTGTQRAFNTITIDDVTKSDLGMIEYYGDNQKTFNFDFITNQETKALIAQNLLDYWKVPKTELEVSMKKSDVQNISFFDLVSIDYPYRVKPYGSNKLPIFGSARFGSAVFPYIFGNQKIMPSKAFKVIGITENPKSFTVKIKLRQTGITLSDGYFSEIATYFGTAIFGTSAFQLDPNRVDPNIRSVFGAAKFGTVHFGNI